MSREKVVLKVDGMTCDACVRSVTRKLGRVPGVTSAEVALGTGEGSGSAGVEIDQTQAGVKQLIDAVEQIGFHATHLATAA
jgi:copper chaperone CopZ